ncbi:MAG: 3-deoxy-D-manno-octulosonic acid transferase [Burkholderiales bacterium]|nr:3-deoxy-D-manno-octulosonic acid transferase [Burkholderiales bacterium]
MQIPETLKQRLARWAYTFLLLLILPLVPFYLWKRARKQPAYRQDWAQRFFGATGLPRISEKRMWVHAVSVGETHAIAPLVFMWEKHHPGTQWVFTSTTPTGRETAQQVFRDIANKRFVYLPYDLPWAVHRFLKQLNARMGWLVETELWPNLLHGAERKNLPMALLNARVSPTTAEQLQRYRALSEPALGRLGVVICQTQADANAFSGLGRVPDAVAGNLKFDVNPKPELLDLGRTWRQQWDTSTVFLAASTREGEESLLLQAWQHQLSAALPTALPALLVVPRHPQRFAEVADLFESAGFFVSRRSEGFPKPQVAGMPAVLMGDSMGEMPAYYASADIAFMGGSWAPLGGQNLIEACACDCPVLLGPYTFNFAKASEDALTVGAALRFENISDAMDWAVSKRMTGASFTTERSAAQAYAKQHRGAAITSFTVLQQRLASIR